MQQQAMQPLFGAEQQPHRSFRQRGSQWDLLAHREAAAAPASLQALSRLPLNAVGGLWLRGACGCLQGAEGPWLDEWLLQSQLEAGVPASHLSSGGCADMMAA